MCRQVRGRAMRNYKRMYPAYTLEQLKAWLADQNNMRPQDHEIREKVRVEIEMREKGMSKPFIVPQAPWN